jgi:coproporphyrinogen III oxidase-like Fe-S oxidoreductase
MLEIMNSLPIRGFRIMDDSFLFYPLDWFKNFNKEYKSKINLPFSCLSNPLNASYPKLKLLVDCGLHHIQLGLQTGSERINFEIYERRITNDDFLKTLEIIYSLEPIPKITLDLIFDNPFEKDEDKIQTIELLKKIKIPFKIGAFALTYYPKTKLYEIAEKKKIINKSLIEKIYNTSYHEIKQNHLNNLIMEEGSTWEDMKKDEVD